MSPRLTSVLAGVLLCLATLPISVSAETQDIRNDFAYGVAYDWSNLDEDIDSLTGIDLNEILSRTMLAASDAGLNLTVAQLSTGSSNIFVESAEDRTPTTIDLDGDIHDVWVRMTDVTIRHAVLFDSALITEWMDTSDTDLTGFDGYLSVDSENALAVDVNMIEYLDDNYNLYGVDMDFSVASQVSMEFLMNFSVQGGGETTGMVVDFGTAFDFDIQSSSAEWRLGHETPIFPTLSNYESIQASCTSNEFLTTSGSEASIGIECGSMEGDYSVSTGFTVDLNDVPTEDFGLDSGLLDISITDEISSSGSFELDMAEMLVNNDSETLGFGGDAYANVVIDQSGQSVDVVSCNCGTANPLLFLMLGGMLSQIGQAFGEDAVDELGGTFETELGEAIQEISEEVQGITNQGNNGTDNVMNELEIIVEAFLDSSFLDTIEAFGENLESRLGGITEDFAYTDAMFVMLWSPTHHTVVGVSLAVSDNMDRWYTLVGPEVIEVYSNDFNYNNATPPASIGLTYYIGSAAIQMAQAVEQAQSVGEIADISAHAEGMGDLAQMLEDAGVNPADVGIDEEDTQIDGGSDDGSSDEEPPATAEELIEEGGFGLPSVSGLATVAVLALAGIVAAQRNRDEE